MIFSKNNRKPRFKSDIEGKNIFLAFSQILNRFSLFFVVYHAATDDCPANSRRYSEAIDKLRLMVDLKPKVIEDAINLRDQFPCNDAVLEFLEHFVSNCDGWLLKGIAYEKFCLLSMNQFSNFFVVYARRCT